MSMPRDDAVAATSPDGASTLPPDGAAVRMIVEALKGPVAEVFRKLLPAVAAIPGDRLYALAIANSDMLDGLLKVFERKRAAFAHLLVDARGRQVGDDFVRLRCGRSVHDIVAMIVRTHAKQRFGETLGGNPNDPTSEAGRMYGAINEYLIHHWQVPLVPTYAELPVEAVEALGPALLDAREAKAVAAIAAAVAPPKPPHPLQAAPPAAPPKPAPPKPAPAAAQPELTDQQEFWWDILDDVQVVGVLGRLAADERIALVRALATVNEATHTHVLGELKLSTAQAAICLASAWRTLGAKGFEQIFGTPGKRQTVVAIAQRMRARDLGSRTEPRTLYRVMEGLVKG